MHAQDFDGVINAALKGMRAYLDGLPERRVWSPADPDEIRASLPSTLPGEGVPAAQVIADLARDVDPYLTAMASGRFFGFVIGGLHPAALGAELLAATWDQNAGLYAPTPGVMVVEEIAARWLVELLGLPEASSVGFVTGGQMATFTCLAAARSHVLRAVGWDVEGDGLFGAPAVTVVVKEERHSTVHRALRFLGLGERRILRVPCDDQARMDVDALRRVLDDVDGPVIVCVEAGNVNTGSFDDFEAVADAVDDHRDRGLPAWVHADGAVGLLAAASPSHQVHVRGLDRLDSWSTDAHKMLNVAYDCGVAITRHPDAHSAAMSVRASYLVQADGGVYEAMDWVPEHSRRARGLGVYATLRALGRRGVADLIERTTLLARRFAEALESSGRAEVVNEVVLNQVLVRWLPPQGWEADVWNDEVTARTAQEGTAFFSGTTWQGRRLMRISVADHATDEADVDRAVAALLAAASA